MITYASWQSPLYFIEEDRDPARNLPRTMIGGVLSVIGIYLLVNIALLKVLPMSELSGATFPAADAARVIAGAHGGIYHTVVSDFPCAAVKRDHDDGDARHFRFGT